MPSMHGFSHKISSKSSQITIIWLSALLFFPLQIIAISGFEITPSLLLFPLILKYLRFRWQAVMLIVASSFLALGTMAGILDSSLRNPLSAVTAIFPIVYMILGAEISRVSPSLEGFSKPIFIVFLIVSAIIVPETILNGGRLRMSGEFTSGSYSSLEASYINSIFPFYGKFGVLTFATILSAIIYLSIPTILQIRRQRIILLFFWGVMLFITFSLVSLQIIIGNIIFISMLLLLMKRRIVKLIGGIFFILVLMIFALNFDLFVTLLPEFIGRHLRLLALGDMNTLTSGRFEIYATFFSNLQAHHVLLGCGFCVLPEVFDIGFSSVHSSLLTALGKGGMLLVASYVIPLGYTLWLLLHQPFSNTRNVYIAAMISFLGQSFSWDILQLQVMSPIIFAFAGFVIMHCTTNHHLNHGR